MKTLLNIVVVLVVAAGTARAQSMGDAASSLGGYGYHPGQPAWPNCYYYGWPWYYRASTWQEGFFRGKAYLMDAAGRYNYLNSLARTNELQTQRLAQENRQQYIESQLRLRAMRSELQKAETQKRAALNRQRNANRPQPPRPVGEILTADAITWPKALQDEKLSHYRDRVNLALEEKARTGKVSAADSQKVQEMTADILDSLKADIRTVRPQDYLAAKRFVHNLLAEM